jgi:hypothetical protein
MEHSNKRLAMPGFGSSGIFISAFSTVASKYLFIE